MFSPLSGILRFAWANRAITQGRWSAQHEPRETPRQWNLPVWNDFDRLPKLALPEPPKNSISFPPTRLRRDNLLLIGARTGQEIKLTLRHLPVADYQSVLGWELRDPSHELLRVGTIDYHESNTIAFTPKREGIYLLGLSAGGCAYRLTNANAPVGIHAGKNCSVIGGADHLYFHVPPDVKRFALHAGGRLLPEIAPATMENRIHRPSLQRPSRLRR